MKKISAAVAAVLVSGVVVTSAAATAAPAFAQERPSAAPAARWTWTGNIYGDKSGCVDAGQQYQREGYQYQCRYEYFSYTKQWLWFLYIYN
ncbi:hypothetical protein [Embleya sp. NPDC059237]|uniref:hypothetical protein n=1 Tax=Embleya sp. NPDC059237 TaxID=3346784 RepID=UPI003688ECA0